MIKLYSFFVEEIYIDIIYVERFAEKFITNMYSFYLYLNYYYYSVCNRYLREVGSFIYQQWHHANKETTVKGNFTASWTSLVWEWDKVAALPWFIYTNWEILGRVSSSIYWGNSVCLLESWALHAIVYLKKIKAQSNTLTDNYQHITKVEN